MHCFPSCRLALRRKDLRKISDEEHIVLYHQMDRLACREWTKVMDQTSPSSELLDRELPGSELPDFSAFERRLGQMRELAGVIEQAQVAVVMRDLRGIERLTARQQELCNLLRAREAQTTFGCHSQRQSVSPDELVAAAKQVRDLNRAHAALLRRVRRTVNIFCRVLASSAVTYAPPRREVLMERPGK
jgi:flagellar biosynthesis/type III secretory pathway chaperone